MAHMEAVGRGVKANIEGGFAIVNHFPDFFFIGNLGDQAAGYQFVIDFHLVISPFLIFYKSPQATEKPPAPVEQRA